MSTIDLATLECLTGALATMNYDVSAKDLVKFLEHIDGEGFEVRRKPKPVVEPTPEFNSITRQVLWPVGDPSLAIPAVQWPPRGITRLWATNMEPIRDVMSEVYSPSELKFVMERGASLIDASTSDEARSLWHDRGAATESSFTVDGVNYLYINNSIPF